MSITKKAEQKSNDEEGMSFNQLIAGLQRPDVNDGSHFKKMPRFYVSDAYTCLDPIKLVVVHIKNTYIYEKEHLRDQDMPSIVWSNDDHPQNDKSLTKIWGLYGHRPTKEPREAIENFVLSLNL